MTNFIEKHKLFFLLLLSLITLAIGFCFVGQAGKTRESDAAKTFTVTYSYYIQHTGGTGAYTSEDGYVYNASVASMSITGFDCDVKEEGKAEYSSSSGGVADTYSGTRKAAVFTISSSSIGDGTAWSVEALWEAEAIDGFNDFIYLYSWNVSNSNTPGTLEYHSVDNIGLWGGGGSITISFSLVAEPETYTIKFNSNGGSSFNSTTSVKYFNYYKFPATDPTRTGYTFGGWYFDQACTSPVTTTTYFTDTSKTQLYAKWNPATYNVTWNAGNGIFSNNSNTTTTTCTYLSAYVLPANPKRVGYTFSGWYTGASGTGSQVTGSTIYTATSAVTLYAKWTANTYTISFNYNGGTGGSNVYTSIVATYYAVYPSLSGDMPTRTGYSFTGYWTATSGGTRRYNDSGGLVNSSLKYTIAGNTTLYAQWTENTYNIAFNANGGSGSMSTMTGIKYTASTTLTKNAFTKTGYQFAGWATSASGSVVYSDGQSVSKLTAENEATVTLYAKWTPITYKVIYNANGGSGEMSETEATYDSSFTLKANTFTCANKLFMGWATSASGGVTYKDQATITTNLKSTKDAEYNLYAVWLDTWANHGTTPSGSGTESSPYLISTPAHLGWIANQVNNASSSSSIVGKYFKQTATINLSGYTWLPIGNSSYPFVGTYDGNGYAITNLNTSTATRADNIRNLNSYVGMFGYVTKKDEQTKTTIKNVNLLSGSINAYNQAGAIAGYAEYATITGCQSYLDVDARSDVGGLVGRLISCTVSNCYIKADITGTSNYYGGFVGYAKASTISSCGYEGTCNFPGSALGGLFMGYGSTSSTPTITDCFAVSDSNLPFVGSNGGEVISNCLYIANSASSSPTKKYYSGTFTNWVIPSWVESTTTNRTPLPAGLSWLAIGGDKVTGLSQITALGYVAA